jgi:CRISPR system Cascade subunit CasA
MNVAFDPWIPIVNIEGKRELASLCNIFTEGNNFADLAIRPHERVALMRLFICVAHAALQGPKDYDEWETAPQQLPEAVKMYLTAWKDSFELFHKEKPWLQVAELKGAEQDGEESGKTSPIALLDFELATGNNSTLNDHGGQMHSRHIELSRVALTLLTFQNFSSGGGSPVAQWKKTKTSQVGNPDAPCLSQSMAHCLFRGKSLAATIHLNLPTFETLDNAYKIFVPDKKNGDSYKDPALGRPVWELFPESPENNSDSTNNATKTYIGRLVPISRWVRLIQDTDQMYCCNGFKYDTFKDGFAAEPTAVSRLVTKKDKKGVESTERRILKVEPSKALWRELSSLIVKRSTNGLGGPLAMANISNDTEFDLQVCAMTRNQASMDVALESVFHVSPTFHKHLPIYQEEIIGNTNVIGAEGYARKLRWAIENYRLNIDSDWQPRIKRTQAKEQGALKDRLSQVVFLSYWTTVEKNLPLLMAHIEAIGTDAAIPSRDKWRSMLFRAACDAYCTACGQETPRQIKAFAKGWQKLTGKKHEAEHETNEITDEVQA